MKSSCLSRIPICGIRAILLRYSILAGRETSHSFTSKFYPGFDALTVLMRSWVLEKTLLIEETLCKQHRPRLSLDHSFRFSTSSAAQFSALCRLGRVTYSRLKVYVISFKG